MAIPRPVAEAIMRRALELARRGQGKVEPNPAVGAVIVDLSGNIISEGWHREFGGPHAEIDAIANAFASRPGQSLQDATLFVTLEPCCHFGKTPPCSRAVIASGIRHVVVAIGDPAPHVNGGGIAELRAAGIEVETGLLEAEARLLISPFIQLMKLGRPWFHAKWAMTLDGKIASRTGHSKWITNEKSRQRVHELRGRMDGILVGIGTALADDPLLTARPVGPRTATRIVIDSKARLPINSKIVNTVHEAPVLVLTSELAPEDKCMDLRNSGVEVLMLASDSAGHPSAIAVATELGRRRMTNVLIEGGGRLLGSFFDARLIDEVHVFIAPKLVGGAHAVTPISGHGRDSIPEVASLDATSIELHDDDVYVRGSVKKHL